MGEECCLDQVVRERLLYDPIPKRSEWSKGTILRE